MKLVFRIVDCAHPVMQRLCVLDSRNGQFYIQHVVSNEIRRLSDCSVPLRRRDAAYLQ